MPPSTASRGVTAVSSRSPMRMVPPSGACTPAMILIRVDLPAPFSPSSACTSPGWTSKSTSLSTRTPAKDLETPRSETSALIGAHRSAMPARARHPRLARCFLPCPRRGGLRPGIPRRRNTFFRAGAYFLHRVAGPRRAGAPCGYIRPLAFRISSAFSLVTVMVSRTTVFGTSSPFRNFSAWRRPSAPGVA